MNRYPYQKVRKPHHPKVVSVAARPPGPSITQGGIGWEYVYPEALESARKPPPPDDLPARYTTTPGEFS